MPHYRTRLLLAQGRTVMKKGRREELAGPENRRPAGLFVSSNERNYNDLTIYS